MDVKMCVANNLESLARDIAINSACVFLWGETEMPECLREEVEEC